MWFTKFYNIRWSQKESFNKDLYTGGVFDHKFFQGVGGWNLNELFFKNFKCSGGCRRVCWSFELIDPSLVERALLLSTIHSARVIRICCQNLERLFTSLTQQHCVLVLKKTFLMWHYLTSTRRVCRGTKYVWTSYFIAFCVVWVPQDE